MWTIFELKRTHSLHIVKEIPEVNVVLNYHCLIHNKCDQKQVLELKKLKNKEKEKKPVCSMSAVLCAANNTDACYNEMWTVFIPCFYVRIQTVVPFCAFSQCMNVYLIKTTFHFFFF